MGETTDGRDILWSAMLGAATLPERIEAAAANGYRGLTVRPDDVDRLEADGLDPATVVADARQRGVERLLLEAVSEWYDHEPPPVWFPSAAHSVDDFRRAAVRFGSRDLNAIAPFATDQTVDDLTEGFATLCDQCAEDGIAVHLEFIPFPPIGSVATAWEIVRGADRPNGGILFDTWHFFRGQPDLELLATIPGNRIFAVQVSDGAREFQESLVKDTFRHRMLPGTGVFDLRGALRTLRAIGGLGAVGPEVLSVELDALPRVEAARLAGEAVSVVLASISDRET
jgi:sugar phosphate isomerase/epimerase